MAKNWLRELRDSYPTVRISEFIKIIEEYGESDELLNVLDEAEARAVIVRDDENRRMRELGERFAVSEQHTRLHFVVQADVDLEHTQALIMYGFLRPGSASPYIGSNILGASKVKENVAHKLGPRFSRAKYERSVSYLEGARVIKRFRMGGEGDDAFSLSPSEKGVSTHGAQIIRVAMMFLRQKR